MQKFVVVRPQILNMASSTKCQLDSKKSIMYGRGQVSF
jgi:hypothetical protein